MKNIKTYYEILSKNDLVVDYKISDYNINHLTMDSRDVINESIFVCKGAHFHLDYLVAALEKGAKCYVSEVDYKMKDMDYIIVSDIRVAMGILGDFHYESPWKKLKTIGITGTKGKSTTAYMIKAILDEYEKTRGNKTASVISSIEVDDGLEKFESHLTTPEAIDLQRHFFNSVEMGREFVAMEISSQALKYNRVDNILFDYVALLNIGYDHVSPVEHKDFEDYFESKLKVFTQGKVALVNLDSDNADLILAKAKAEAKEKVITFGLGKGDFKYSNIEKIDDYTKFTVLNGQFEDTFKLSMPGLFNVSNAICAIAICYDLGIEIGIIKLGLEKAKASGRMELYKTKDHRVIVIIDYAHNKLSFETLFSSTKKEYPNRNIISVFGCPGKKALDRRKDLGEIAGKYAHKIIVTEEDYGEENLEKICEEIKFYTEKVNPNCEIILDREAAIKAAIEEKGEIIILLTGKGRETRQKRGTEYINCKSDLEIVLENL